MRNYEQTYTYDEIGNLLQMKSRTVWTRDYKYNFEHNNYLLGHDLDSNTATYVYDEHGNMIVMPHLSQMNYDYADQLHEVSTNSDGNKAFYVYDAGGNRVRKVVLKNNKTITEERFYVGDYEYFVRTGGSNTVERKTLKISDDKQVIALYESDNTKLTTIRYQITNHLDSASLELDENGKIISYEEYHPFGTTSYRSGRSEAEVSLKRYKYVFKELDNETGLYYYGMRYYAPWIARFISVDPLQFKYPIYTPYQYAGNKPISYIDLDGAEEAKPAMFDLARLAIDNFANDKNTTSVFNNLDKKTVVSQLRTNINTAEQIISGAQQSSGLMRQVDFACGQSALAYVFTLYNPLGYVSAVTDLYQKGSAKINGNEALVVSENMRKATFSEGKQDGALPIDYILIGAIGQSQNNLADFADGDSFLQRGTTPWEMKQMSKRLGLSMSGTAYLGQTDRMFGKMQNALKDNKLSIIFETHAITARGVSFKEQLFGIHYTTLHDLDVDSDGYVNYNLWSYGQIDRYEHKTLTMPAMNMSTGEMYEKTDELGINTTDFKKGTKGFWIITNGQN